MSVHPNTHISAHEEEFDERSASPVSTLMSITTRSSQRHRSSLIHGENSHEPQSFPSPGAEHCALKDTTDQDNACEPHNSQAQQSASPHEAININTEKAVDPTSIANPTWLRKLGKYAIMILLLGTLILLGTLCFATFLWFSSRSNSTWRAIVIKNWLTVSVTILGETTKQAVSFQIGILGAMLAAIALERGDVLLKDAASMTIIRAGTGAGSILELCMMQSRNVGRPGKGVVLFPLFAVLGVLAFAFSQVITIILASDIGLQPVPGYPTSSVTKFGFSSATSSLNSYSRLDKGVIGSTWLKRAETYSTFAEYSEPPVNLDGVEDTGVTLRAFLPYSSMQTREETFEYNGRTTVLDSRVTCQVPNLQHERIETVQGGGPLMLTGQVRASRSTPRLGNTTFSNPQRETGGCDVSYNDSMPFSCIAPTAFDHKSYQTPDQWRATFCQLGEGPNGHPIAAGGLVSEFKSGLKLPSTKELERCLEDPAVNVSSIYGTAYLMLNVTTGDEYAWENWTESGGRPPNGFSTRGEWMDLVLGDGALVLSVTLCYSAFDIAYIPVSITSTHNRTESGPTYDPTLPGYTFPTLRQQYGQYSQMQSLRERGLLSLEKQESWVADTLGTPPGEPYVRDFANLAGPEGEGNKANFSAPLWFADTSKFLSAAEVGDGGNKDYDWLTPDAMHIWLFQDIVQSGGSVAFAIQSLLTLFTSMTYYDQIGQFDSEEVVSRSAFVIANTPLHYRGFLVVLIVLLLHLVFTCVVTVIFLMNTRYSLLGGVWQGLAQSCTTTLDRYLSLSSTKRDSEIGKLMGPRESKIKVKLAPLGDDDRVGLVAVND